MFVVCSVPSRSSQASSRLYRRCSPHRQHSTRLDSFLLFAPILRAHVEIGLEPLCCFSRRIFCLYCFLSHILSRPFAVGSHYIVSLSLLFCVRSCDHFRCGFLAGRSLFLHSVAQLLHRFKFNSS